MTAEHPKAWDEVVATYKSKWSTRGVLFDDGMVKINDALSAAREHAPDVPSEPELKPALEKAAPIYRSTGGLRTTRAIDPGSAACSRCSRATCRRSRTSSQILIHESSHQWGKVLMESIARASKAHNKTVPRQLWHAVLFYNAGELTRRAYLDDGIDDYTEIAVKLYPVLCGEGCRDRVAAAWTPHLDGKATVDEAIDKLVSEWP